VRSFSKWLPPYHAKELITPEEAADVIKLAENNGKFKPAQVMYPTGETVVETDHCSCAMATFWPGHPIYTLFAARVIAEAEGLNRRYQFALYDNIAERLPSIHVLRYDSAADALFRPHVDLGGQRGVDNRKLTFVTFLNDDYEGGRLHVDVGEQYDTQAHAGVGVAAVFPSFTMHHVTPVTKGVRYVAVGWLHGPKFR
jgi:hypothetical protein